MQEQQKRGFEIGKWYKYPTFVDGGSAGVVLGVEYMFVGGAMASPVNGTISLVGEVWSTGEKRLLASDPDATEGWEECAPPKDAPVKLVNRLRENGVTGDERWKDYLDAWARTIVESIDDIFTRARGDDLIDGEAHARALVAQELDDAWNHRPGDGAPPEVVAYLAEESAKTRGNASALPRASGSVTYNINMTGFQGAEEFTKALEANLARVNPPSGEEVPGATAGLMRIHRGDLLALLIREARLTSQVAELQAANRSAPAPDAAR